MILILVCGVTWAINTLLWIINSVLIDLCVFSFQYDIKPFKLICFLTF